MLAQTKTLEHVEFETKYRIDTEIFLPMKMLVEQMSTFREFIYAEGPDEYFTKDDAFIRYRKEANKGENARAELTMKIKPEGAKNNIMRAEYNIRVDGTPRDVIVKFVNALGFNHNFTVMKSCFIYRMEDATLVYYTVADVTNGSFKNINHFVEIEVSEEKIHAMTVDQAWEVLTHYEKALEVIGVNPQKRLKKSLFEMYRKD